MSATQLTTIEGATINKFAVQLSVWFTSKMQAEVQNTGSVYLNTFRRFATRDFPPLVVSSIKPIFIKKNVLRIRINIFLVQIQLPDFANSDPNPTYTKNTFFS